MPHLRAQLDHAIRAALDTADRPLSDRTIQLVVDAATKIAGTMLGRLRADRDQIRDRATRRERRPAVASDLDRAIRDRLAGLSDIADPRGDALRAVLDLCNDGDVDPDEMIAVIADKLGVRW